MGINSVASITPTTPDDNAALSYRMGNALLQQQHLKEALAAYDIAIALKPDYAEAHNNRGSALLWLGHHALAQEAYQQAIRLQPDYHKAHNNLGNVLQLLGKPEEALAAFQSAITAYPNYVEAHHNSGHTLQALARFTEALAAFECAIAIQPDFVPAQHSRALLLLLMGQFEQGMAAYHWREKHRGHRKPPATPHPRWQPTIANKRVLVWAEQGIGDEIFFSSFLPDIKTLGIEPILQVDERLLPLFQRSFANIPCIPTNTPLDASNHDCHMPMGDLPALLWQTSLLARRTRGAYLTPDRERAQRIRQSLYIPNGTVLCGISWASSSPTNQKRNIPLSWLTDTLNMPSVALVSLQYGNANADTDGTPVLHCAEVNNTGDLDGLAALIDACDVVISIANATAHLAGALGKETWVLVPQVPDWRWQLQGSQSEWYPSVQLFRQAPQADWQPALQQIRTALTTRLQA